MGREAEGCEWARMVKGRRGGEGQREGVSGVLRRSTEVRLVLSSPGLHDATTQ